MHQPNIHQVRESLAEYLEAAERGEEVVICRRNQPVARLVAIERSIREPRPIGLAADAGSELPEAFWEPLPGELVAAFDGADPSIGPRAPSRRRR